MGWERECRDEWGEQHRRDPWGISEFPAPRSGLNPTCPVLGAVG